MTTGANRKDILVYADWIPLKTCTLMGTLSTQLIRGHEIFSFEYDKAWLNSKFAILLDPELRLFSGPQYPGTGKGNFGLFTDSSPDRWGRVLMQRREALFARQHDHKPKPLFESDYLLGVFDLFRMGGLRFKLETEGEFLDNQRDYSAPPFLRLRALEAASLQFENVVDSDSGKSDENLKLLLAPGASLGGARPKASVVDKEGNLWIAKFPSLQDDNDTGAWEAVVNQLAQHAGISVAEGYAKKYTNRYHTYHTRRFDRSGEKRIHFASAMTLMGLRDGADSHEGISYLHLAECIVKNGASPQQDLKELWSRIVFSIYVSNTDDHLRNHGFLLTPKGWRLSPAYDMNPVRNATGLQLNITELDNALDPELAREVAPAFRVSKAECEAVITKIKTVVGKWDKVAKQTGLSRTEISIMEPAFRR